MCFRRKPKEIVTNLNISSKEIVVHQKFKKDRIYLGTKIKIPRNFAFAICTDGHVLDVLDEEVTKIEIKAMPNATRKLELYKVDRKQRPPKYFNADTYFVNLNTFEKFKWETAEYAELEDKLYGAYKTSCFGELEFKITDPTVLLNYLFKLTGASLSIPAEKIITNYINERVVRILNKANPTARDLYLKDNKILKLLFEKLGELLSEIGITLYEISLTETRFPPKILNELKNANENPVDFSGWGISFEQWQESNPLIKPTKKPKFVTVVPTGKEGAFFEESMAPYFFEEEEAEEVKEENKEKPVLEPIWKGIDEKTVEEQSKKLVDLDDTDEGKK